MRVSTTMKPSCSIGPKRLQKLNDAAYDASGPYRQKPWTVWAFDCLWKIERAESYYVEGPGWRRLVVGFPTVEMGLPERVAVMMQAREVMPASFERFGCVWAIEAV